MAELRWWWQPPFMEDYENQAQDNRIQQAKVLTSYVESNPQLSQNLQGLIQEHFYLPKDVLVGASLIGLTAESPELAPLVERWLDNEKTWWDKTKAVARGAVRTAFVGMESAAQELVKKPLLATQKYLNDKKHEDGIGMAGAMLQLYTNREAMNDWQKIKKQMGPSVGREAIKKLTAGEKVNLGEGYFGNSTIAEDTDIFKEMVARGADPGEVKEIVQSYYGQDITNAARERNEGLSFKSRNGQVIKLTPAAPLVSSIIEPGTQAYNVMSGIVDAAMTLFLDPTILLGGYLNKAGKAVRSLDQSLVVSRAGIINNSVRKTVHVPTATEYVTKTKGGQKIVDQFVLTDDYTGINNLLRGQGDATLHAALKNSKNRNEVQSLLIDAIEQRQVLNKLDPNSMVMRGKISSTLGRAIGGEFGAAVGLKGAISKGINDTQLGRIFAQFPVPKLYVNDLNQSFFDLRDWMKFAKVDDSIANPALDKLSDMAAKQKAKILNPDIEEPVNAIENMNEVLEIWNQVLTHIGEKFSNVGLPEELVKGVRKWMSSIDQTRMYFVNELGELEWFVGSKYEIIPKEFRELIAEELSPEDTRMLTERIVSKFRKNKAIDSDEIDTILQKIQDASNNILEPEARQLVQRIHSGYYEGAERAVLDIAEELGVGTTGRVPYGYTGKVSPVDLDTANFSRHPMNFNMSPADNIYGVETSTMKLIMEGKRTSTTRSAGAWATAFGKQIGEEFSLPFTGQRLTFFDKAGNEVAVQVTQVRKLPQDLFTNPQRRVLLEDIISKEGWTEAAYQRILNEGGLGKGFPLWQVEYKPLQLEGRYDQNKQRMLQLGLSDNLDTDLAKAEYDWGTKADRIKVELSDEVNQLPKNIQGKVKLSMTQLGELEKKGSNFNAARQALVTQREGILAKYEPTGANIAWAKRTIAQQRGVEPNAVSKDEALNYLNSRKSDELTNPVTKEAFETKTITREAYIDERTGDKRIDEISEEITRGRGRKTAVTLDEAIENLDENIARIQQQVEEQVFYLENNVPKFKELNKLNANKPKYGNLEKDWGAIEPGSFDYRTAAANNLANSDGALVVLSGAGAPGQGLKSSKNFLENGKWDDVEKIELEVIDTVNPDIVRANPDKIYLFGDNLQRTGKGGQAVIRDEPNAFGIATKKAPKRDDAAFFTDADYDEAIKIIDEDIQKALNDGRTIVIPKAGLGTGRAQLATRAPKINEYLQNRLRNLSKSVDSQTDISPGLYQGNIPHIVVNPNKVYTPDEIREIQTFLKTNKINDLGVVGSSDLTPVEATKLKTLLDDIIFQTESTDNLKNTVGGLARTLDEYLTSTDDLGELAISEGEIRTLLDELVDELKNTNILEKIETNQVSKARPTAHLISEYYNDGFIPMPDARLFLRVFRPLRELGLRLRGKGSLPAEDFDKLLAKPITDLAELALKEDKTLTESVRLWVKSARTRIKMNVDEDGINQISEGLLTAVADGYMQRIWKPSVLIRPAWVLRVVGEEQLRMWAADLDNVFAHPLSAFAWIIGRKPQRSRQFLQKEREMVRDDYLADTFNLGRGSTDIFDESLELAVEHQQALTQSHAGILFGLDPRRARGFKVINKGEKGFYNAWTSEILQLHSDELASRLAAATVVGDPTSPAFVNSVNKIKEEFWSGDLSKWRKALVANSDDDAKQLKALIMEDKKWSDSYVDSVVARVHLKTGGKYRAHEVLPNGKKIPLDLETPRPMNPSHVIEYQIIESGDHELLRQIGRGHLDESEHGIQIFNTKSKQYEDMIFNRKMSRSEFRKYSTWLNKYKTDAVSDNFKVKASRFEADRDYAAKADQVIETLYAGLMGVSTNELSRSSAFRQFYWRFIEGAYANMDDAARAKILAQANDVMGTSLPGSKAKKLIKNLETMGKADVTKAITVDDLRAIDDLAKSYALQETKGLLYDLNKRHVISDQLRLIFPFAEVYMEIAGTWTKLLKTQKMLFGRKLQRTTEAFRKPSVFGTEEDEGFFTTDPQTGQEMYNMAGFDLGFNVDRALNNPDESDIGINPITGRPDIGTPRVKAKMVGYASGLNMVAGSVVPGLGPLAQLPASAVLPTSQSIDEAFFPYGRPEGEWYDPRFYVTSAMPNWFKKILAAGGSIDKDLERQYSNEVKTILRAMNTTGIFDDSSPAAEQESLERARKLASHMLLIRGIVQAIAPSGPVFKYEYQIGPEGSHFLDPTQIKEEDPDNHYFAEVLLSDAYYQFLAEFDGDRVQATGKFIKMFGFDPTALLTSKSKKIRATTYTVEGGYFYKQNKELMDKHPDIGYYMFPDSPLDEFDFQAWADAFASGDRVDLTDVQYQKAIRQAQGSLAYENYRRMLMDGPMFSRVPLDKKFEMLYLFRLQVQKQFPGYGQTSTTAPSLDVNSKIDLLINFIATEQNTEVTLPDGSITTVSQLPAIRGTMQYIATRQFLLEGIKQRYGANASISRAEASEARRILRNTASQLMSKYPDFYYVYYDLFRLEAEEISYGMGYEI